MEWKMLSAVPLKVFQIHSQGQSSGARLSPEKEARLTQREVVSGKESVRRDGESCSHGVRSVSERDADVLSELVGTVRSGGLYSFEDAEDGE